MTHSSDQPGPQSAEFEPATRKHTISFLRLATLCIPVVLLLAARLADVTPIPALRHAWNDTLIQIFKSSSPPENPVLIVAIDDASLADVGRWPWDRGTLADLVTAAADLNPSLVGINLLLAESQIDDGAGDDQLAEALSAVDTVLGSEIVSTGGNNAVQSVLSPFPLLRQRAAGEGFLSAFPDFDGRLRGQPAALSVDGRLVPSFAAEIIREFNRISTLEVEPGVFGTPAKLALANERLYLDWQGRLLPDFGALAVADQISAIDLLNGNV
ncbi:MAG: CHASE2 domain-containing protein, partial [Pseudomonadota bacterium]